MVMNVSNIKLVTAKTVSGLTFASNQQEKSGSVMSEAGVCVSAIRLLNSLHEQAWVQVGRGNDTEKIRLST